MRDYLFANGVDRDTVHLNDFKFFKSVKYILVSIKQKFFVKMEKNLIFINQDHSFLQVF